MVAGLQEVMETQHKVVVDGAPAAAGLKDAQEPLSKTPGPALGKEIGQADRAAVLCKQFVESFRGHPNTWVRRMDVHVKSQDAIAFRGTGREGVDVQQVIASAQAKLARRFLLGPETGPVKPPVASVAGQQGAKPTLRRTGKRLDE